MMRMKQMRAGTMGFVLLGILGGLPATVGATVLEVPSVWPRGSTWHADLELAAADIAEATDGRVEIVLEKTSALESIPELAVYTMPLLFRNEKELEHVREQLDDELVSMFAERGLTIWDLQTIGTAHLFSRLPIDSLEDFLTSRVWVPKEAHDVKFDEVGLEHPVPLDLRLLRDALRDEEIDTFFLTPTAALLKRYHTRVSVVSKDPITYVVAPLSVKSEALGELSAEDRTLVEKKLTEAFQRASRTNREKDAEAMSLFEERESLEVTEDIDFSSSSWQEWAEDVRERLVETDTIPKGIYEKVKVILQDYRDSGQEPDPAG